jgi:tetratricopeptide (TPR) repeat protein
LTQAIALSGLGGIGKTQAALEYAYRYGQEYQAVFWLAAESSESLMVSLQQMADLLQLPEREAAEQSRLASTVRRWLASHQNWLVIADNVEDLDVLQPLLPALVQGALLLTTRRQALGTLARSLEVPPMSEEEGIELLLARSGQSHLHVAKASQLPAQAAELVHFLEGLPLALDQAGSYLQETGCQVADYVQRYQQQRKELLLRRGLHTGNHPASVATTVMLAVEQVAREHPAAPDLLRLCAFLHPDAIPEEMLMAGAPHLGPVLGPVIADPYQFDLLLAAVRSASLISRHAEGKTLSVHRLVQAVIQDQMEPEVAHLWRVRVVQMVATSFPEPEFTAWPRCERLLQSALACAEWLEAGGSDLPDAGELLSRAGIYLIRRGRFDAAESLLERAVTVTEKCYGPDHAALIPRLLQYGEALYWQGKYETCELLWYRTLALCEHHLGSNHVKTVETINNLALVYYVQAKYEQSEQLFYQALSIQKQLSGSESREMASLLSNLGLLYQDQKKFEQAEKVFKQALHILEQQLGAEHMNTVYMFHNLANAYRDQGKYEQAEPFYQQVLSFRKQHAGPEHPDTATSLHDLALLRQAQGNYTEACSFFERALHIRTQVLGLQHPQTRKTSACLADLLQTPGEDGAMLNTMDRYKSEEADN